MGNEEFDRNEYLAHNTPRPPRPSRAIGTILTIGLLGLLLVGLYLVVETYGFPGNSLLQAYGLPAINFGGKKSDQNEQTVKQRHPTTATLRRRHKTHVHSSEDADGGKGNTISRGRVLPVSPPPLRVEVYPPRALSTADSVSLPNAYVSLSNPSKRPGASTSARNDRAAGQIWEATANRLGDVVGQLNQQQEQIDAARQGINQLAARMDQRQVHFEVTKRATPTQIGRIKLKLESTNAKQQRYSMRVFLDDHWVELKDRASEEEVRFASDGVEEGFSLIVSQVYKGHVEGYLSFSRARSSGARNR